MRFALVNPRWSFEGSTYFGCRDEHTPIELLYAASELRKSGHEATVIDANMEHLEVEAVRDRLRSFDEDFLVIPTAPSYLFWRCPQPELRVPATWIHDLDRRSDVVIIGPHGSVTPVAALKKTGATIVLRGEPDQTLPLLASTPYSQIPGCCWREGSRFHIGHDLGVTDMRMLGEVDYSDYPVELHQHQHHVFDGVARLGAEIEFARGCPYACTFCNKTLFRNKYRERDVDVVLQEIDYLIERGVEYIYFVDEIFGVGRNVVRLLKGLVERPITFGCQSRVDLWNEDSLELLSQAHCISLECGIESISADGRNELNKNCQVDTARISALLSHARKGIPWVQANLIRSAGDDVAEIRQWQSTMREAGVWVSEPVPLFPFPGSPEYVQTFGKQPDEDAWERAHSHYLRQFEPGHFSDIQDHEPLPLFELECTS